jgi:hypothetical protein
MRIWYQRERFRKDRKKTENHSSWSYQNNCFLSTAASDTDVVLRRTSYNSLTLPSKNKGDCFLFSFVLTKWKRTCYLCLRTNNIPCQTNTSLPGYFFIVTLSVQCPRTCVSQPCKNKILEAIRIYITAKYYQVQLEFILPNGQILDIELNFCRFETAPTGKAFYYLFWIRLVKWYTFL